MSIINNHFIFNEILRCLCIFFCIQKIHQAGPIKHLSGPVFGPQALCLTPLLYAFLQIRLSVALFNFSFLLVTCVCVCVSCKWSFYSRAFEKMFQQCLELPSQSRHSICFPLLCTHFMSCTHELCPEEVNAKMTWSRSPWMPSTFNIDSQIPYSRHLSFCAFLCSVTTLGTEACRCVTCFWMRWPNRPEIWSLTSARNSVPSATR